MEKRIGVGVVLCFGLVAVSSAVLPHSACFHAGARRHFRKQGGALARVRRRQKTWDTRTWKRPARWGVRPDGDTAGCRARRLCYRRRMGAGWESRVKRPAREGRVATYGADALIARNRNRPICRKCGADVVAGAVCGGCGSAGGGFGPLAYASRSGGPVAGWRVWGADGAITECRPGSGRGWRILP